MAEDDVTNGKLELRPIAEQDIDALLTLLNHEFRSSRGVIDQNVFTDFPLVFAASNYCNCRVITEYGEIISHAALWKRDLIVDNQSFKVGVIVLVATHLDHRKRGHASTIMHDLQRTMHEEEFDLGILWTGVPAFYEQLGWETVVPSGSMVMIEPSSLMPHQTETYEILPFDSISHLEDVVAIHEQEPIRMTRSREEYRALFGLPKVHVSVAIRDSRVKAYLVHAVAVNKSGIVEYGGELEGITALIRNTSSSEKISWVLFHPRADLATWADSSGFDTQPLKSSKGAGNEMIYIIDSDRISAEVRRGLFVWGLDCA